MVGEGAFGTVYLARERGLGREVALKVLKPMVGQQARDERERFRREVALLRELPHPGLVPLLDACLDQDPPFLVSRWMPGGDLKQRVEQGPMGLPELVRGGARLARALDHLHRHGVLHRDVKPANLLRDQDGEVYLADLGLGLAEDHLGLTATGMVVGTPLYMAPEVLSTGRHSPASDLFALGAVLLELCQGAPLTAPSSLGGDLTARLERVAPPELGALLTRCLAPEPARRPPGGAALAEALEALVAEAPPRPATPDPGARTQALPPVAASESGARPLGPGRQLALAAGLLAIGLAGGLALGRRAVPPATGAGTRAPPGESPAPDPEAAAAATLARELAVELDHALEPPPEAGAGVRFLDELSRGGVAVLDRLPVQRRALERFGGPGVPIPPGIRVALEHYDGSLRDLGFPPVFRPFLEATPHEGRPASWASLPPAFQEALGKLPEVEGPGAGWARAAREAAARALAVRADLEARLRAGTLVLPESQVSTLGGAALLAGGSPRGMDLISLSLSARGGDRERLRELLGPGRERARDALVAAHRALELPGFRPVAMWLEQFSRLLFMTDAFLMGSMLTGDVVRFFGAPARHAGTKYLHATLIRDLVVWQQRMLVTPLGTQDADVRLLREALDACLEDGYDDLAASAWSRLLDALEEHGDAAELDRQIRLHRERLVPRREPGWEARKLAPKLRWLREHPPAR